jgi:hypothetical protein
VKLIYQMFAKLLSWMVLHVRSDTANEIEILGLRHQLTASRRRTPRLDWSAAPCSLPSPDCSTLVAAAESSSHPTRFCTGTETLRRRSTTPHAGPGRPPSPPVSAH